MSDLQQAAASITDGIPCKTCRQLFPTISEIRSHRKTEHPSYRPCRNFPGTSAEDRCKYGAQCNWKHIELSEGAHICWNCGNIFKSISDLNFHRKQIHNNMGPCKKLNKPGGCSRGEEYCLFKHETQVRPEGAQADGAHPQPRRAQAHAAQPQSGGAQTNEAQDFQQVPQNTAPPNSTTMNLSEKHSMMEMMRQFMLQQQTMTQQIMTMLSS